jgi:hypothetical protein
MNWGSAMLWGFAATIVLTTLLAGSRALGLSRIDIPFMLGTLFTANRDRAVWVGLLIHLFNGWIFAFIYIAAFHSTHRFTPWFGMAIGLVHASFVLLVGMKVLPAIHPRMAGERQGPDRLKILEPPGWLALNYGYTTPLATIVSHLVYGLVLGTFYAGSL